MTISTIPTYETRARQAKATRLADVLRLAGITAADAAELDEQAQAEVAVAAGINPPSSTTWTMVLGLLVTAEVAGPDPFAGIGQRS